MNIQIPPNLSPGMFGEFLHAGINDWGGISPVTPDFVNPEMPWPSIRKVKEVSEDAGFELKTDLQYIRNFSKWYQRRFCQKCLPWQMILRDEMAQICTLISNPSIL